MVILIHYKLFIGRKLAPVKLAPVKPDNAMGFRKLHNFVHKSETFCKSTSWNSLETLETLHVLVSKLPGCLKDTWNGKLKGIRNSYGRAPSL